MNIDTLSLYIHFPWCEFKCPYCDFNSYVLKHKKINTDHYIQALIKELREKKEAFQSHHLNSIFIGGGTPSLMSVDQINRVLKEVMVQFSLIKDCEITIEMNPESIDKTFISALANTSINRISVGVQSFCDNKLKSLGRLHSADKAKRSLDLVFNSFDNVNIDIMYGLPNQTVGDALYDIKTAFSYPIKHFSWYQLTIEPQTGFAKRMPENLPNESTINEIETVGLEYISKNNFERYEISAYALDQFKCQHNLNYWLFGDYIGIGAGAHSKRTWHGQSQRHWNHNKPETYLSSPARDWETIKSDNLAFEYFLNRMRLKMPIERSAFIIKTGLLDKKVEAIFSDLEKNGLVNISDQYWSLTSLGFDFYNDVVDSFISEVKK